MLILTFFNTHTPQAFTAGMAGMAGIIKQIRVQFKSDN